MSIRNEIRPARPEHLGQRQPRCLGDPVRSVGRGNRLLADGPFPGTPRRRQVAGRQDVGAHHRQPAPGLAPLAGSPAALLPAGAGHQKLPRGARQRRGPPRLRAARQRVLGPHHGNAWDDHRGRDRVRGDRHPARHPGRPSRLVLAQTASRSRRDAGHPPLRIPASHHLPLRRPTDSRRPGHAGLRPSPHRPPHQPRHPSGPRGSGRGGQGLRSDRASSAARRPAAAGPPLDHGRTQPDPAAVAVDGWDRGDHRGRRARKADPHRAQHRGHPPGRVGRRRPLLRRGAARPHLPARGQRRSPQSAGADARRLDHTS